MATTLFDSGIEQVDIQEEIQRSYLDYAMSVIVGRALPDVRDGLKPVQRRILYSMFETGLRPDRPFRKCAAAVGEVMKKYHPHGDQAIYDALVRMGQPFTLRSPLIAKKGNFGSVDGDEPAAMRYCLTGDALVRLADGSSIPIAEIAPGAAPDSDTDIDLKLSGRSGTPVRATRLFHSGVHPTLRMTTREGYRLEGTPNHPVLCLVPVAGVPVLLWKLLDEIHPGDRVALVRRPPEELGVLSKGEEDLAILAGAFVSEGWMSTTRAGFNNVDEEFFGRVVSAYDAVVGGRRYVYSRTIASSSLLFELDVHHLTSLRGSPLAELIGTRSAGKRVPSFVWRGGPGFKAVFLRALFEGDGSSSLLRRGTIQITYSTRSDELARGVQQLLLEFGVISRLCRYASGEIKVVITNRRDARLFARHVGFLGRKQAKLDGELAAVPLESRALSSDHVPFLANYIRTEGALAREDRLWLTKHNVDRIERWERDRASLLARIANPEVRAVVEPLVDGSFYFAEVRSVEDAGEQAAYSLRVDADDHAFITNGFISHNTEARLSQLAMEMLREIDQETVDFIPNYDGYEQEPVILPSRIPNLLVNGAGGIAVGMATNIPPHNLGEVIDGVVAAIDNPKITSRELTKIIKGPDFPTAAQILGRAGIRDAYETGRGSIKMRGVTHIEENSRGRQQIVVTEVPYQVNPASMLVKVAQLRQDKRLPEVPPDPRTGKPSIRNESKDDLRLVIELRPGANPHIVLNKLYKHTQLQDTFGVIMLALVDNVPRVLTLVEMVGYYIDHQIEVITRRTRYQLRRAEERDHIVKGLLIALDHIDEVIKIIRAAQDADVARTRLMTRFKLSEIQANHILDMPLRRLTKLARAELEQEHKDLLARIKYLKALLADPKKIRAVIKEELLDVKKRYADKRRTQIKADEGEMSVEDLVAEEDVVITVSRAGYVKRLPVETYRRQGRGGRGVIGASLKEEDVISHVFTTTTHHWLLFFTSSGKVYRVKVHEIPESSRTARGMYAANLPGVVVSQEEKIQAVIHLKDYEEGKFLVFATRRGMVKRTALPEYDSPRTGLTAINLHPGDELIGVMLTDGKDDLMVVSRGGLAARFAQSAVRPMGRATAGVIGMRLSEKDEVLALVDAGAGEDLISVTENGYGKRTAIGQYPRKGRPTKGVVVHKLTSRTGGLAGAFVGSKDQDLFQISSGGIVIRVPSSEIRRVGRASQGVRTMRVDPGGKVVAIAPVVTTQNGEEA